MLPFLRTGKITVNFLIAGVQKAGTTSLDHYLRQHPEVEMANTKEVHFFDDEKIFSKTKIEYNKLTKHFDRQKRAKVYGENTPIYLFWEPSMRRIRDYNPSMKIIAILRNPIERAFSGWNMERNRNMESDDFLYAIQHEAMRMGRPLSEESRVYSYTSRGLYAGQIRRAFDNFPKDQLLFIKYEDYVKDPGAVLLDVFEFLKVDPEQYRFNPIEKNKTAYLRPMSSQEKQFLLDFFEEDISEVEILLGWNCSDWKT